MKPTRLLWPVHVLGKLAEVTGILDSVRILHGLAVYAGTGVTPPTAYQSLIGAYCRTSGWSNDLLHAMLSRVNKPHAFQTRNGILGSLSEADARKIATKIRRNGYYVFPTLLPSEVCDRLVAFASTNECSPSPAPTKGPAKCVYDPGKPLAPLYRFREEDLLENADVQNLMSDPSVLAVAQAYLGCGPILDILAMWWSAVFGDTPSDDGAQRYHFDMDRVKWLKFFVYLTDVTPESGPHCFIAGSHRSGCQPRKLLRKGYARLSDEEVRASYPSEAFVEFTGPRGTIFAEDTRGLHKGKVPRSCHRLAFELEYTGSLFGGCFQSLHWKSSTPQLAEMNRQFPRLFKKYAAQVEEKTCSALAEVGK